MDKVLTRLILAVIALTMAAVPASAQQIAADFAQIDDCGGVNRFAARHSRHPSYSNYSGPLANLRRTYCRPPTQQPQTAAAAPAPGRQGTARPTRAAPARQRPQTSIAIAGQDTRRPPATPGARPTLRPQISPNSQPPPRAPAPVAQAPQSRYLSALQVAALYREHYLCYEQSASGSCGAFEAAIAENIGSGGMRLIQRYGFGIADHLRRELSAGAPFLAEAMLVTGVHNVTFAGNALCRTRNQRILDAYQTEYHLQEHDAAGPATRMEEVSAGVLDRMRDEDARAESETPATLICSRYRRDPAAPGTQIVEEAYFDGELRSTATVRLLPRRQGLPTLHW